MAFQRETRGFPLMGIYPRSSTQNILDTQKILITHQLGLVTIDQPTLQHLMLYLSSIERVGKDMMQFLLSHSKSISREFLQYFTVGIPLQFPLECLAYQMPFVIYCKVCTQRLAVLVIPQWLAAPQ